MHRLGILSKHMMAVVVTAACAVLWASPAMAQAPGPAGQVGHWNITPFIGAAFAGDLEGGSLALGAAAGYNWSRQITFEGEFSAVPSAREGVLLKFDANAWNLTGNVLYHFARERRFHPYIAGGSVSGHASADLSQTNAAIERAGLDDTNTSFIVNAGAGVERALNDRVNLRGD